MSRRVVLVTGAAAGIGRAVATRFARAGWLVGAYDVDAAGLASLAEELGDTVLTGRLDVRDPQAWGEALDTLTAESDGALDVLVNNAGILASGLFVDLPLETQQRIIEVNVLGVLNGCHTSYPYLRRAARPHVVNLASASAVYGQAELATYSASKFAVRGLTEALDLEWGKDGITVTALWPLFVATAMTEGMDTGTTRALGIRLTADDVAAEVFAAATSGHGRLGGVHRAVGLQARAFLAAANLSPSWAVRRVNKALAGR